MDRPAQQGCPLVSGVGQAKMRACAEATGQLLVELDHDDLLIGDALEKIVKAHANDQEATLFYSHSAQVREDGSPDDSRFTADAGWTYRTETIAGRELSYPVSMQP